MFEFDFKRTEPPSISENPAYIRKIMAADTKIQDPSIEDA
jgi:hypothetical protein